MMDSIASIMMDLMGWLLMAAITGTGISIVLCAASGRGKRPSFWLAPLSALATGILFFLGMAGGALMFTWDFSEWFNDVLMPGLNLLLIDCSVFGAISFLPSLGVIAIYRRIRR